MTERDKIKHAHYIFETAVNGSIGIDDLYQAIKIAIPILEWEIKYGGNREVREIVANFEIDPLLPVTDALDPLADKKLEVAGHIGYQLIQLGLVEFIDTEEVCKKKAVVEVLIPKKEK